MEKEKGVPEVDFPLLTHLLSYVPQISQIYTDLETCSVFEEVKNLWNLWDIKIFSEKKNLRDLYCKRAHIICVRKYYILFFEKWLMMKRPPKLNIKTMMVSTTAAA